MFGGIFSVALVFPRLIVRGIPLFKGTPCSMQSGLSSAGKRTVRQMTASTGHPPGRDCPRPHVPIYNIYQPAEYASYLPVFFDQITPIQYKKAKITSKGVSQRIDKDQNIAGENNDF